MEKGARKNWLALLGAVFVSLLGQTMLKSGANTPSFRIQLFDWHTFAGLFCYCAASPLYFVALRRLPISVAMPFTAISYAMAALIGRYWFSESLGDSQVAGILAVSTGVLLMTFRRPV
jgi:small multidrug resistance pump